MDVYEQLEKEMQPIFTSAIVKAQLRCDKPGNTATPWIDCSVEHLEKRLLDEVKEYLDSRKMNELLDVINLACFLYLAKRENWVEKTAERMGDKDESL